ncbi:HNH endonuclease [Paraburkholderia sp. J10-1]|uniref:HNH endonuclease signature motif containing protein n=1 Tax=Paraburkholderia sp. J10-1 TaxID=2805430 RepID=UPI002AB7E70C|nr:HNH endonuclease [Paraburkholderia sp. J10-1]
MNKLPRPAFDDAAALRELADNDGVGSYPHLKPWVPAIVAGYGQYKAVAGNALEVVEVPLDPEIETFLKGHYGSPPKVIAHITGIRKKHRQRVCPMCGSMHSGTLDHVLPKDDYAAFAVFSLNLVPACECNNKRGKTTVGAAPGARVLHPYFDDCLSERLIAGRFEDLGLIPRITLRILLDDADPHYEAVKFHVAEIVGSTAILEYLSDNWTNLCELPEQVVRGLGEIPASVEGLQATLSRELELLDMHHKGKNNWNSVFVRGLLDPDVTQWLFDRLTAVDRPADGSLV